MENLIIKTSYSKIWISKWNLKEEKRVCKITIDNWDDPNEEYDSDRYTDESTASMLLDKNQIIKIINQLKEYL